LRYGSSEVGTDECRHKFFLDILQVQPKNHSTVRSQHFKSRAMRNFGRFEEWNHDRRNVSIDRISESTRRAKFVRRISWYPNSRFRIQTFEPLHAARILPFKKDVANQSRVWGGRVPVGIQFSDLRQGPIAAFSPVL